MFGGQQERIHQQVTELLPWLVNGSLTGRRRSLVESHLRICEECRLTRDRQQQLRELLQDDPIEPDYRPSFRRLMRRIDFAERNKQVVQSITGLPRQGNRRLWLASVATVLLISGFVLKTGLPELEPVRTFKTLTTSKQVPGSVSRRALLSFEADSNGERVKEVLVTLNAMLVDRPDEQGRYLIDLRVPPDRASDEFIDSIRRMRGVREIRLLESEHGAPQ